MKEGLRFDSMHLVFTISLSPLAVVILSWFIGVTVDLRTL